MTELPGPRRWRESPDTPDDVRRLVAAARPTRGMSDAARARIANRLAGVASTSAAAAHVLAWKTVAVAVIAATVGAGPSERTDTAMVAVGTTAVLYGGEAANVVTSQGYSEILADTWVFDGTSWTDVSDSSPPGPRYEWTNAASLGTGGFFSGGFKADDDGDDANPTSWVFDGAAWTLSSAPSSPQTGSTAADGAGVVQFAGTSGTWIFDGTSWSQVSLAAHPVIPTASWSVLTAAP